MEHSALHALLLTGLIAALGGVFAAVWLVLPASRKLGTDPARDALVEALLQRISLGITVGALAATLATFIDFFVQVAEGQGQTVFAGADLGLVFRFATQTTVGQLDLLRAALLLLTAACARWSHPLRWWLLALFAFGAMAATGLVSHAAAQPENRTLLIAGQIIHLTAAAGWMGVLLHLFAARTVIAQDPSPSRVALVGEIVRRFSPFAFATTTLLMATGVFAAFRFLPTIGALFTSPYGLTLLVKLTLLAPAVAAGYYNFRHLGPSLLAAPAQALAALPRFIRSLELEVTAGLLVIAVAGVLGSVSPPGEDGSLRLTAAQTHALLSPDLPTSHVDDWMAPEDPRGPTTDDLRYSEFTHNWSGVLVTLLGLCWLVQTAGGRLGLWAGRAAPFVLLPFGAFITFAANPELWLLHQISPWEAITNPQILEHQLGALMVFLLAWLGWRDLGKPPERRPLGFALPVIMIFGSLLLLGHAHSSAAIPDDLTNLINVQHAVFGAFGLFAGAVRWSVLRGLIAPLWANRLWPSLVIGLGLFMAFFYREIV